MPQSVPELPDAVLGTIFQHVPLKQRLSCCALVCRAWAAAASATTAHLDASVSASNAQALESWIDRHAEQLASINLHHSYHGIPTLELHCSKLTQLQQLVVSSLINLQLHTGQPARSTRSSRRSSTSTSTLLLPHLRDLQLHGCSYPLQHLKQLSKLTALTSLYLGSAYVLQTPYSQKVASADAVQSALSSVLSQMHCLRKLAFGKSSFLMWHKTQHPAVRHLSSMQSLESLQIMHRCPAFETFLPHLPSSITALLLSDTEVTGELQAATRLTALRHFELNAAEMDPGVLLSWPSLQHLHLSSIMLTCASAGNGGAAAPQPAALLAAAAGNGVAAAPQAAALLAAFDAVMAGGGNGNAEAPAVASAVPEGEAELQQFLQALQQLTQLQHLHLAAISLEAGSQAVLHQQQQFSALVASPELTSLELAVHYGMPLPLVGLRQQFAPGAQLPALRVLRLRGRPAQPPEPQLGANDLVALAAACPGLQELVLEGVTAPRAQYEQLLTALGPNLQTLRMLQCGLDNAAAAAFTSLCGLRSLALIHCQILPAEMLQLATLSRLTHLLLCGKFKRRLQRRPGSTVYHLDLHADPEAEQPDVWQQLANWLDKAGVRSAA